MDYAQILSGLFVGSHPKSIADIELLRKQSGIAAVLNLQTDEDMQSVNLDWQPLEAFYRACGIDLLRLPVKEEQIELRSKLPECVRTLAKMMKDGRTGYLHWSLGWEFDVAVSHVKRARQCSPHLEALRLAWWDPIDPRN